VVLKRVIAVVIAIAIVALAVVLRAQLHGDDGGSGNGGDQPPASSGTVWCITELAAACDALQAEGYAVQVGAAGDQAAAFESPTPPDVTAWVTLDAWPPIVDTFRGAKNLGPLFTSSEAVASTRLALVGPTDKMAVLAQACGGQVTWTCLGEQAGTKWDSLGGKATWQQVKPAHADPTSSAVGLAVLGQAAASWFGSQQPPVAADAINPVDFDGPFRTWFENLQRNIPSAAFGKAETPLGILLTRPFFDVVGTTEAEASLAPQDRFAVTYPEPVASATAVVASTGGELPSGDVDVVTQALAGAGWTTPPATGPGGLPPPAVLIALQNLWKEVVR
jgi:hypothetical protein